MAARPIAQADLDREAIRRRGFAEFIRRAWRIVEPSAALRWNWHIDAIVEYLLAVQRRQIRRLVINVPPGMSKSLTSSVLWPAYVWTQEPGHRFIAASFNQRVVYRDAEKHRSLVKSDWYRACFPDVVIPSGKANSDAVDVFRTTAGGMRYSVTVRGGTTGEHGDTHLIDDPLDPMGAEATSGLELEEVLKWYGGTMSTRFRDHTRSATVCIMQRLHDKDLAGEMIRMGAEVLCLPMRYDPGHPHRWIRDPRAEAGAEQLLDPVRVPEESVCGLEKLLLGRAPAQLGQRPVPPGGLVFKAEWFRFWTELPDGGEYTISVDCTFAKTDDGSFVVIQVWYQCGPNFYLVEQWRERLSFPETITKILAVSVQYPRAYKKLVENKANGPAVVATLETMVPGLHLVEPVGGKEARANGVQPLVASHNVYLPDPVHAKYPDGRVGAKWVNESEPGDPTPGGFLGEVTRFPKAATDDQTDTMTQFLAHAGPNTIALLEAAMKNLFAS